MAPSAATTAKSRPRSSMTRLIICVLGINVCYLYYGVLQERLFRPDAQGDRFDNTLFLFATQCLVNALFAAAGSLVIRYVYGPNHAQKSLLLPTETAPVRMPGWLWLCLVSLSYLLAMLTSNEALRYVSYPAQALAKSCKMVPVMLGSALLGVKYTPRQYAVVFAITAGVFAFQMGGGAHKSGPKALEHEMFGNALLLMSLALDGVTGSNQHLLDREYQLSTHDLMFGMNAVSCLYLLALLTWTGELSRGLAYLDTHPTVGLDVAWFALSSALGQNFIFYTITGPGPLACTTITTTRKFLTIIISALTYPDNRLDWTQWMGVLLVFSGLGAELAAKIGERRSSKKE